MWSLAMCVRDRGFFTFITVLCLHAGGASKAWQHSPAESSAAVSAACFGDHLVQLPLRRSELSRQLESVSGIPVETVMLNEPLATKRVASTSSSSVQEASNTPVMGQRHSQQTESGASVSDASRHVLDRTSPRVGSTVDGSDSSKHGSIRIPAAVPEIPKSLTEVGSPNRMSTASTPDSLETLLANSNPQRQFASTEPSILRNADILTDEQPSAHDLHSAALSDDHESLSVKFSADLRTPLFGHPLHEPTAAQTVGASSAMTDSFMPSLLEQDGPLTALGLTSRVPTDAAPMYLSEGTAVDRLKAWKPLSLGRSRSDSPDPLALQADAPNLHSARDAEAWEASVESSLSALERQADHSLGLASMQPYPTGSSANTKLPSAEHFAGAPDVGRTYLPENYQRPPDRTGLLMMQSLAAFSSFVSDLHLGLSTPSDHSAPLNKTAKDLKDHARSVVQVTMLGIFVAMLVGALVLIM